MDVVLSGQFAGSSGHLHADQRRLEALRLVEAKVASAHGHRGGASYWSGHRDDLRHAGEGENVGGFRDLLCQHGVGFVLIIYSILHEWLGLIPVYENLQ